jgi:Protein of unknown function (DUF3303)
MLFMVPAGLRYLGSGIETNFDRRFQFMECDAERLFADWTPDWSDLMDFEVVPVATSEEIHKVMSREV